jgi:glycerate kinase
MKIVLAPNAFKESLTAIEFCQIATKAIHRLDPHIEVVTCPVADGGDGTMATLNFSLQGHKKWTTVKNPVGRSHKGYFFYVKKKQMALLEMAAYSGLNLIATNQRNPLKTSSYGTGQILAKAIDQGAHEIILGIGGSATVDGGAGMAQALGLKAYNDRDELITKPLTGGSLGQICRIDLSSVQSLLNRVRIKIACDVDNPLLGRNGAARIYGPQKGAQAADIPFLEKGLKNWVKLLQKYSGRNLAKIKGAGAAGGLALPLMACTATELLPGTKLILDILGLAEKIKGADLVITGEGRIDDQTLNGKAPYGVYQIAARQNIPVVAVAGAVGPFKKNPFYGVFSIVNGPISLPEAMDKTPQLLEQTIINIIKLTKLKPNNI